MKPFTLTGTDPEGKTRTVWACGKCGFVCHNERHAVECCDRRCCNCQKPSKRIVCDDCERARSEAEDRAREQAAAVVHVSDYNHTIVCIGYDNFQQVEYWVDDGEPPWVWAVADERLPKLEAVSILEGYLEDFHEEAIEDLDVQSLQEALDEWHSKQTLTSYSVDFSRRVVLEKEGS